MGKWLVEQLGGASDNRGVLAVSRAIGPLAAAKPQAHFHLYFMQKIRKIVRANSEKSALCTYGQTYVRTKHEGIKNVKFLKSFSKAQKTPN